MGMDYPSDRVKLSPAQLDAVLHIVGNGVANLDAEIRCCNPDGPGTLCKAFEARGWQMMAELRALRGI